MQTAFNTSVQHHGTEICRKLNKHSCLLRYPFNIQHPPGLHSLEPAVTVHFHFKKQKPHVRILEGCRHPTTWQGRVEIVIVG